MNACRWKVTRAGFAFESDSRNDYFYRTREKAKKHLENAHLGRDDPKGLVLDALKCVNLFKMDLARL